MARDYSRWLEDSNNPDVKEFVEGGGYGTFAGWWGSGENRGFLTSNNDGRPPGGSYFKDGKYFTVSGTDQRMIPPDYELIGIDEAVVDGDVGSQHATPGRMILKRRQQAAVPAATSTPAPSPASSSAPRPPADRMDASNPSLASALRDQRAAGEQRPALQDALDSALEINRWKDAGSGTAAGGSEADAKADSADGSGRRFAASDRWRQRLQEVSSRFA